MVDAMRSMLDELMGKERNVPLAERTNRRIRFTDEDVCKYELVAMCPNQLFKNTRSDLGPCGFEIHQDHLEWESVKEQWEKLDERGKDRYPYERDYLRYLDQLIRDMDRKIAKAKERAAAESAPRPLKPEDAARIEEIEGRMREALERSEKAGEEGDVDASLSLTQQAEAYKRQAEGLRRTLTAPDRTMEVCDICGVFINSTDNEQRRLGRIPPGILKAMEDHLTGKQYLGWKKIRETFAELTKKAEEKRAAGGGYREGSGAREERRSSREPGERGDHRDRGADRDRERERRDDRHERGGGGGYDRHERGSGSGSRDYHSSRDRERSPSRRDRDHGGSRSGRYDDRGYGRSSRHREFEEGEHRGGRDDYRR